MDFICEYGHGGNAQATFCTICGAAVHPRCACGAVVTSGTYCTSCGRPLLGGIEVGTNAYQGDRGPLGTEQGANAAPSPANTPASPRGALPRRNRLKGGLIGACLVLVLATGVGIGVGFGHGTPATPTTTSTSTSTSTTTSSPSQHPVGNPQQEARTINNVIHTSASDRVISTHAIGLIQSCSYTGVQAGLSQLQGSIQNREQLITSLRSGNFSDLPNASVVIARLTSALQASVNDDQDFAAYANDLLYENTSCGGPDSALSQGSGADNTTATQAKQAFVDLWNPIDCTVLHICGFQFQSTDL